MGGKGSGRPARSDIYLTLDTQIEELWLRLGGLPTPDEAADIWDDIWTAEAHHSTAIEGNTLVIKQVEQLLKEGRAVGGKALKEYNEVKGYADAATWVYREGIQPSSFSPGSIITLHEIRNIHQLVMQPVWDVAPHPDAGADEGPGSFRRHEIAQFSSGMKPPSWTLIDAEIRGWVDRANKLKARGEQFPEEIAQLHRDFEYIHPFLDGNGRTGRLVLNLLLVRSYYPPAIIYKGDRSKYLKALARADNGDVGALGEFIARAILQNLHQFIVPAVAGPSKIVPLAALANGEASSTTLRVAANRGRLKAHKGPDGQWRSSRKWVDEYLTSRVKR